MVEDYVPSNKGWHEKSEYMWRMHSKHVCNVKCDMRFLVHYIDPEDHRTTVIVKRTLWQRIKKFFKVH